MLSTAEYENTHKLEASFAYNEGLLCIIKGSENTTVALYSKGGGDAFAFSNAVPPRAIYSYMEFFYLCAAIDG